ncbi:unnamed protein product [Allacma fusca]|uniref:Uncharacterized protein n=1 Tax=Allacma fusca TaxID=39272 RepID=A0A8J2KT49_9HEXA|nr:unnamed protein product [Allacma fusca]
MVTPTVGMDELRGRGRGKRPVTLPPVLESEVAPGTFGNVASSSSLPPGYLELSESSRSGGQETRKRGRSPSVGIRGVRRGGHFENSRFEGPITVTRSPNLSVKKGSNGTPIDLITNYFPLRKTSSFDLTKYRVNFLPEIDNSKIKKRLLRSHGQILDPYIFDGDSLLFLMKDRQLIGNELSSPHPKDPSIIISITIQEVGDVQPLDVGYSQVYNVIFRNCLNLLNLENLGRHFYDMNSLVEVKDFQLNIARGYITSIRKHEHDMLLCVDTIHKVIRTDTVWSNLKEIRRKSEDENTYRQRAADELIGSVVITTYKNRTYCIADIDWDTNPDSTFDCRSSTITFTDYYSKVYGIDVTDKTQPLLHVKSKVADMHGHNGQEDKPVYLIPELCNMTGLTCSMRNNFPLMKALADHLHQEPTKKLNAIRTLMRKIVTNPRVTDYLGRWGLSFESELIRCVGRVLQGEKIIFSAGSGDIKEASVPVDAKADWTAAFRNHRMLSSVGITKWTIITPTQDCHLAVQLASIMRTVAEPLGFSLPHPAQIVELASSNVNAYLNAISGLQNQGNDFLFIILSSSSAHVYNAIKSRLTGELGQISQCMLAKNLKSKALRSIATKLIVQINAKLGGEPWTVHIPLKKLMVVGVDFHRAKSMSEGKNVVAMVSTTSSSYSTFFSTVSVYKSIDALSLAISSDLIKCVVAYEKLNGERPSKILLFRIGSSGDGDLERIIGHEIRQINETLHTSYSNEEQSKPLLSFINVSRKVNTRIFRDGRIGAENPPPGTVCDDVITLPERYDFFLIPQNSRQGSVSPSGYNILYDDLNLGADKMQRLTYKLCHMYFNWAGTVAVPAPCQYAHKLASLTGLSLGRMPTNNLGFKLHFL